MDTLALVPSPQVQRISSMAAYALNTADVESVRKQLTEEVSDKRVIFTEDQILEYLGVDFDSSPTTAELDAVAAAFDGSDFDSFSETCEEEDMYIPFINMINAIVQEYKGQRPLASTKSVRKVLRANRILPPSSIIVPHRVPDVTVSEVDPDNQTPEKDMGWAQVSSIFELKLRDFPFTTSANSCKTNKSVGQIADYARLHISLRPFQMFTFVFSVNQTSFAVSYWDRAGVIFSRKYELSTNQLVFVRLIQRLLLVLDPYRLGMDPSVRLADGSYYHTKPCPSYKVWVAGRPAQLGGTVFREYYMPTTQYWYTVGPPLWPSVGLFSRGTATWFVSATSSQAVHMYVLKTSWRAIQSNRRIRTPESDLYRATPHVPGVAVFAIGDDVTLPGDVNSKLTTTRMRIESLDGLCLDPMLPDVHSFQAIMHRLVLYSAGEPLYNYNNPSHLIEGLYYIVIAHKEFVGKGYIHRDFSIGNLFLSKFPELDNAVGFMADIELMRHVDASPDDPAGPDMTGTAQFMAVEIVKACVDGISVQHMPFHDLESLVWVYIYAVFIHEMKRIRGAITFELEIKADRFYQFYRLFGQFTYESIMGRKSLVLTPSLESSRPELLRALPEGPLKVLAEDFINLVRAQNNLELVPRRCMTHDMMINALAKARMMCDPRDKVRYPKKEHYGTRGTPLQEIGRSQMTV